MPIDLSALKPCDQRWDEMREMPGGRLCAKCDRRIVDFRRLAEHEVARVHAESDAPVCGVYTPAQLVPLGARRGPSPACVGLALAAAVGAALLAAPTAGAQAPAPTEQAPAPPPTPARAETAERPDTARETFVVRGTVRTSDGAAAPGVVVSLRGTGLVAVTDSAGRYFLRVPATPERGPADMLEFRRIGFARIDAPVAWVDRETTIDPVLTAQSVELSGFYVVVQGERPSLPRRIGRAIRSIF